MIDTVEGRIWDNQLEAASVAKRVLKKTEEGWCYAVQPYEEMPGHWSVRFKKA